MADTAETADRVETADTAAPALLTRLRSSCPRGPVGRSIAALRRAVVRSDDAAPRSSVRDPDGPATRGDRRLDGHLDAAPFAARSCGVYSGPQAASHYRHRVLHRLRRPVHYCPHRSVHHCWRRFVHRCSPRHRHSACGTARVRTTVTASRTGIVTTCAIRRVSRLRVRTDFVAQLRDLGAQRFDELFDFRSIRHGCLVIARRD